jgi:hypothetical protein
VGTRAFSWEQSSQSLEVNHSTPSSAEVKNEWSCTSAPPVCRHGLLDREENFILILFVVEMNERGNVFKHESRRGITHSQKGWLLFSEYWLAVCV